MYDGWITFAGPVLLGSLVAVGAWTLARLYAPEDRLPVRPRRPE